MLVLTAEPSVGGAAGRDSPTDVVPGRRDLTDLGPARYNLTKFDATLTEFDWRSDPDRTL